MRYVVGYTPNERGADAVALASALAKAQGAQLDLVYVVDKGLHVAHEVASGHDLAREQAVQDAQREGLGLVPEDVPVEFHVRHAESFAAGLIEAAVDIEAGLIVVGAASNGLFKRHTVGSVANALLHASPVPVALAPRGYRRKEAISRLTLAVGQRAGADAAIDVAIGSAERRGVPLRMVSLVELDAEGDPGEVVNAAHIHANTVLTEASRRLPEGHRVTVEVAHGRTIEECIDDLDWDDGEILIVGSSRLAERNKLFIGSTANKVLRALPVPMVVIPREYERVDTAMAP
ncbi:nucleotide-binding universal stress UspA family protein [Arthrobacter sp. PvP023]|uniref:universal stress protein n=1 Tax=Micrococcaceae TaxID=1268 RepID=UPI001AE828EE|nr:universal stress protein [Arthrobacter sp. PvP023]MBP1135219.1 nucleotide-binding universal stress UspA family protein [Arthrobacter sp. PvP023]